MCGAMRGQSVRMSYPAVWCGIGLPLHPLSSAGMVDPGVTFLHSALNDLHHFTAAPLLLVAPFALPFGLDVD